jgi:hypothetical protein
MSKSDRPYVFANFLTEEENAVIERFLDKTSVVSPNSDTHRCALGYSGYKDASRVSMKNPAAPLSDDEEDNKAVYLITEVYDRTRLVLEKIYGEELALVQASYTEYSTGPGQWLHSDMYDKDGNIRDDDISIFMKYSAVLYLSSGGGVDFAGGDLYFPAQEHRHIPQKAELICFIGDMDHRHVVEDVDSGVRKSLSMFYGLKKEIFA